MAHVNLLTERDLGPWTSASAAAPLLTLEVVRGKTRFPDRPINADGFLIGASRDCELRLGGDDMPALHSSVQFDGTSTWIESLSRRPQLVVNGSAVERAVLQAGDRIEIGAFQFVVRETAPATAGPALAVHTTGDSTVSALSAAELIARIEEEEEAVRSFQAARIAGAAALLAAIGGAVERPAIDDCGPTPDNTVRQPIASVIEPENVCLEMELALRHVNLLSRHLEQSASLLQDEEAAFSQAANSLLDAQERLARQLQSLLSAIAPSNPAPKTLRASA